MKYTESFKHDQTKALLAKSQKEWTGQGADQPPLMNRSVMLASE